MNLATLSFGDITEIKIVVSVCLSVIGTGHVLAMKSAMSGDRVQCIFVGYRSSSKHLIYTTQVIGSNFTFLSICRVLCNRRSVWLLFWRLRRRVVIILP